MSHQTSLCFNVVHAIDFSSSNYLYANFMSTYYLDYHLGGPSFTLEVALMISIGAQTNVMLKLAETVTSRLYQTIETQHSPGTFINATSWILVLINNLEVGSAVTEHSGYNPACANCEGIMILSDFTNLSKLNRITQEFKDKHMLTGYFPPKKAQTEIRHTTPCEYQPILETIFDVICASVGGKKPA